jgi:hypothetical protein
MQSSLTSSSHGSSSKIDRKVTKGEAIDFQTVDFATDTLERTLNTQNSTERLSGQSVSTTNALSPSEISKSPKKRNRSRRKLSGRFGRSSDARLLVLDLCQRIRERYTVALVADKAIEGRTCELTEPK